MPEISRSPPSGSSSAWVSSIETHSPQGWLQFLPPDWQRNMLPADVSHAARSDIKPLVVGTEPFLGECFSSVLARACDANVFTKPLHLLGLVGLHAQASEAVPFSRTSTAPAIAKLLGTAVAEIESRMHPAVQDEFGRSTVHWFGTSMERRHIESSVRRFAPNSLEQSEHFPAVWGVRLLDFCPNTMELLLSECPHCARTLGWRACRFLSKCEKCGASLVHGESPTVQLELREPARLGAALVSHSHQVRRGALSSLPEPFATWAPADALLGLLTLGEAHLSLDALGDTFESAGAAQKIASGIEFAKNWPDSLSRFLKASTAKTNSTSVREGLGPLGKLFSSGATRTPIRDLVRSTISASLGEAMVPVRLHLGSAVNDTCRAGMLSALEASKLLGIRLNRLRRLEGSSDTFLNRHKVKGGPALYDQAAILRLRTALKDGATTQVCARQLGLPKYLVEAFILAKILELVKCPDAAIVTGNHLVSIASLDALRERLRQQSRPIGGGITLRKAMQRNGDSRDWVTVFQKMLDGRIRLQIDDRDGRSLSDALIVRATDIDRPTSRRSTGPSISGIDVTCQTAADIIGTTSQFISAAVKSGFLKGAVGRRNSAIPLEGVLTFQQLFVLSEELRETFGGHTKSIACQLRSASLAPVATINRVSVWHRSEIETYAGELTGSFCGLEGMI
jgi:hypothetical protein